MVGGFDKLNQRGFPFVELVETPMPPALSRPIGHPGLDPGIWSRWISAEIPAFAGMTG